MPNDETDLLFVPLADAFALCSIPGDFGIFRSRGHGSFKYSQAKLYQRDWYVAGSHRFIYLRDQPPLNIAQLL